MQDFTHVICPVDFSEPALCALKVASSLAERFKRPLLLLNVLVPLPIYPVEPEALIVYTPPYFPDESQREAYAQQRLQELKAPLISRGIEVSSEVLQGPAGRTIVERVAHAPTALLVLGTHGYRGLQRFLLGSTTVEVLRRAVCPTITVRTSGLEGPVRQIGVGVDFSAACEPAIEAAAQMARAFGAQLHLIHVLTPVDFRGAAESSLPVFVAETNEATRHAAQEELQEIAGRLAGIDVIPVVLTNPSPYRELVRYTQEASIDLLALGTHGRTGLRRLFLGSLTERVLQLASCPVLSVKLPADIPDELTWRDVSEDLSLPLET